MGNEYLEIHFNEELSFLRFNYLQGCEYFTNEMIMEKIVAKIIAASKKYRPKYILEDMRKLKFVIHPDFQEELVEAIVPVWMDFGLKKFAQVLPEEFIANLASEQIVDHAQETVPGLFLTENFSDPEDAKKWLLEK